MRVDRIRLSLGEQLPLYVFVSVLFAAGAAFGVLMYHALTLEQQQNLAGEVKQYLSAVQSGALPDETATFQERAFFHGKWIVLIWLLGATVVGVPLIFALDFLKGVLVGFSAGALSGGAALSWKSALLSIAALAPPNLLIVPALLMGSVSGTAFALYVVRHRLFRRQGELMPALLAHTGVSMLLLGALIAAALLEIYLSPPLLGWAASQLAG